MRTIGFPRPRMNEESRIALLPQDIAVVDHPEFLFFEKSYGKKHGVEDDDYRKAGAHVVATERVYSLDVICQPKFSEKDAKSMEKARLVFGWVHIDSYKYLEMKLKERDATVIEWSNMKKNGRCVFYRNSILTGQMGVLNALAYAGKVAPECTVAVIGRGNVGKGAFRQLRREGVQDITVYHTGNKHLLKRNLGRYDIIVNCAEAAEFILTGKDLQAMRPGALMIDIGGACIDGNYWPNSIYAPISEINQGRNLAYCVNHVPTLAYRTASSYISHDVAPYIDAIVKEISNVVLQRAITMENGKVK